MGYNPKIWGNEGWHFIHMTALNYPENPTQEDKKNYMQFLQSLRHTLPCEGCMQNWGEKLDKHPPNLNSRKEFFEWTVDMHNEVNSTNGKRQLSYDEALKKINQKKKIENLKDSFLIASAITVVVSFYYGFIKRVK